MASLGRGPPISPSRISVWTPIIVALVALLIVSGGCLGASVLRPVPPGGGPPSPMGEARFPAIAPSLPLLGRAALAEPTEAGPAIVPTVSANSTPLPENGTVLSVETVGNGPQGIAYDPLDGLVYVANQGSDTVSVVNGTGVVATIGVGSEPTGVVYDPSDHFVYVTNFLSDNVSVLLGTTLLGWITSTSFDGPDFPAYDALDGDVYVPNFGGASVTLLNGTDVLPTFAAGTDPYSAAYDPQNGYVYVSNDGSVAKGGSTLTVFDNLSTVATLSGSFQSPTGMAYDPRDGYLYVGNQNVSPHGGVVTVVDGLSIVGEILVGPALLGMAYDPSNQLVYAAANGVDEGYPLLHANALAVIDGTSVTGYISVGSDPVAMAVDPSTALLYETNALSANVSVISTALGLGPTSMSPQGDPELSADVGQNITFQTTLWAVGTGRGAQAEISDPSGILHCGAPVPPPTGVLSYGPMTRTCVAAASGAGTIWVNVSDSSGAVAWSELGFRVFPHPSVASPVPTPAKADVGQAVTFTSSVTGPGSGNVALRWNASASLACSSSTTTSLPCLAITASTFASVNLTATDSNGGSGSAASAPFAVYADPQVSVPSVVPTTVSTGQNVTITTTATGGSGGLRFIWFGLPPGCSGSTASVTCQPSAAGVYRISVGVNDSDGVAASSGAAPLTVRQPSASSPSTILGVAPALFYGLIAAIVIAAFLVAFLVRWRRGRAG